MSRKNIAIIGNGVYGSALAFLFEKKHVITLFGRELKNEKEFLIEDFGNTGKDFDYLIISITTKGLSDLIPRIYSKISHSTHIILAMKGLTANGILPIEECRRYLPSHRISILSGPGFAEEIMIGTPVHLVLASLNFTEEEEEDFLVDNLTLDFSHDIYGVSWCGVLKNIYAIGAGMASLRPDFDRSHYTREVVHEISILLEIMHFDKETAHGPAGRGDMWICTTPHSRNFRYGAGDVSLRDQAEGYNAFLQCKDTFEKYFHSTSLPLLEDIARKMRH